ncbi:hypothetical protein SEA_GODONK_213 [Gordonia phage GodonK]|uniref:Uncharacterized protein n=1 Tax=Gordonia phage GodonK TaxID=2562192 RepID=A0A4D6E2R4_9CAUD|nr:hypothetical protein HOV33_gp155 [Gordonia phage GodonK]QBZ72801.1 hypothetical protein SEA_GODONK_213 [Gordonia phage GodonK]
MIRHLSQRQRWFWSEQGVAYDVESVITSRRQFLRRLPNRKWCYAMTEENALDIWETVGRADAGFWLYELHPGQWPLVEG